MIVMKFGGTSVQDSEAISRVLEIVSAKLERSPVVVVSAMAGVTDVLIQLVRLAAQRKLEEAAGIIEDLRERHLECAAELMSGRSGTELGVAQQRILKSITEIEAVLGRIASEGVVSPRNQDKVVSYGERLSSTIVAACLSAVAIEATLVDSRDFIVTDATFSCAALNLAETNNRTRKELLPIIERGGVPVAQGFIGATVDGETTTLGRGGSDYSAAVIGAALGARAIEIWTDADGLMTADPRVVPDVELVDTISFSEAAELAFFGAKILHPSTVLPAIEQGIPIHIYNTYNPASGGTLITAESRDTDHPAKSITFKRNVAVLSLTSNQTVPRPRFLLEVLAALYENNVSVVTVNTREQAVSLTIDHGEDLDAVERDLARLGQVTLQHGKAIVCVVGHDIKRNTHLSGRVLRVLDKTAAGLIGHGSTSSSLTAVVDEAEVERLVRELHGELFVRTRPTFRRDPSIHMHEHSLFSFPTL